MPMLDSTENSFSPSRPMPEPSVKPKMYLVSISWNCCAPLLELPCAKAGSEDVAAQQSAATGSTLTNRPVRLNGIGITPPFVQRGREGMLSIDGSSGKLNSFILRGFLLCDQLCFRQFE